MKRFWLRAALFGFMIAPVLPLAEAPDSEDFDAESAELERRSSGGAKGHAVRGLNFHVWDEDSREATEWAVELLQAGGESVASAAWRAVAANAASRPSLLTNDPALETAIGLGAAAPDSGLSPLGLLLCLLPSLDRTCLISEWATSPNEQTRLALAGALAAPFEAVGVRTVIEHLAGDPSAEVRRLARSAAASHRALPG